MKAKSIRKVICWLLCIAMVMSVLSTNAVMAAENKLEGLITVDNAALYSKMDAENKNNVVGYLEVNTVLELVTGKALMNDTGRDGYYDQFYEVYYTVNGTTKSYYVLYDYVLKFTRGVSQPKNSVEAVVSGLKDGEIVCAYFKKDENSMDSARFSNGAKVYVKESTLDGWSKVYTSNSLTAYIKTEYLVFEEGYSLPTPSPTPTATPTPSPTPMLSQAQEAKEGEYEVVANGTVVAECLVYTNPTNREGSAMYRAGIGVVLPMVSLKPIQSMDEGDTNTYHKVVYDNKYYYITSTHLNVCEIETKAPSYLVDVKIKGVKEGKIVYVRSSKDTSNTDNVIGTVGNGATLKAITSESDDSWTKVYFNNQYAYISTQYIEKQIILAEDAKAMDKEAIAKIYPYMDIIAQAYVVGTNHIAEEKKTVEINPVVPYTYVQGEWITEEYAPQYNMEDVKNAYYNANGTEKIDWIDGAYLAHEATTLSVVAYDEETVIFWSNGYQGYVTDPTKCDAEALMETHRAGFYQISRDMVWLDTRTKEEYVLADTNVKPVAKGVATALLGLQTAPESTESGVVYEILQNGTMELVSTERIWAEDGSDETYYKVIFTPDSTTGYMNTGTAGYYYVNSNYVNVYESDFEHPMLASAGLITTWTEDEYVEVYAEADEGSEVFGYVKKGADINILSRTSDWVEVVFNSQSAYIKSEYVTGAQLDRSGIPNLGTTDIYFTQMNISLNQVYPEIEVIAKARVVGSDGKVSAGATTKMNIVDPYTVIQGHRIAYKYFPDWNISNIKTLHRRYMASTSYQSFTFIDGAYLELDGQVLDVVAYQGNEVIVWSRGYRGFTQYTLAVDCRDYAIQFNHPAGFYSIPRSKVELFSVD